MIDKRTTTWSAISLRVGAIVLLLSLVLMPVAWLLIDALPADIRSLDTLRGMLLESTVQAAFLRTVSVALLACGLASLVAIPAAIAIARGIPKAGALIVVFGILPLAMPPFATAALLKQLSQTLAFERLFALPVVQILQQPDALLVVTYALHYFPLILFCLAVAVAGFDRSNEDTARNLRASAWTTWRQILLPLATPAYVLGATIMLLRIIEDVASPLVMGIDNMLAPSFLQGLLDRGPDAARLLTSGALLLGLSLALLLGAWSAFQLPSNRYAAPLCAHPPRRSPGAFATLIGILAGIAALMLTLLPAAGLSYLVYAQEQLSGLDSVSLSTVRTAIGDTLPMMPQTVLGGVLAGLLLVLLAAGLGILGTATGKTARLMRNTVTLLIAFPGVVLAAAYLQVGRHVDTHTDPSTILWAVLIAVVVIKLLPLGHYLSVTRLRHIHPALAETASTLSGQRTLQYGSAMLGALSGMLTAVFLLGVVGVLTEVSAALVLFEQSDMPFAQTLFTLASDAGRWALPAAMLFVTAFGVLVLAVISRTSRCERTAESGMPPAKLVGGHW